MASNTISNNMASASQNGVYHGRVKTLSAVLVMMVLSFFVQCIHAIDDDISSLVLDQQRNDTFSLTYVNLPDDAGVAAMVKSLAFDDVLVNSATQSSFRRLLELNSTLVNSTLFNSTLGKRESNDCVFYQQVQVVNSGIWWSPWNKVSACQYTAPGNGSAAYNLEYAYTYDWAIEAGPISWGMVSGLIGAQWQESVTQASTHTCQIPASSKGAVWYQTQVLWGNAQSRVVSLCDTSTPWSQYYHFDAPSRFDLRDSLVHLGCSIGDASGCE